jgi:hypothetical protein
VRAEWRRVPSSVRRRRPLPYRSCCSR